jgi:hypothetical protein
MEPNTGRQTLGDVARAAAATIPGDWKQHDAHLVAALKGGHGSYVAVVDTSSEPLVRVEVALPESVPAGLESTLAAACVQANRDWLGSRLSCTERFGGALVSEASLVVGPHAGEIDPAFVRALLVRCITTAASIPPLVSAIERGVPPYDAPSFASDNALLQLGSGYPVAPAADADLMDACLAAANSAGWPARRADTTFGNSPNSAHFIVKRDEESHPPYATVEPRGGCLYATSVVLGPEERQRVPAERRSEVAQLLNGLANRTSLCGFALDFEEGFVRTDLVLDTVGCARPPSRETLLDFIFQAATSGASFREIIISVAHQGADPDVALAEFAERARAR